jgi:predicted RNA binding protein YcfA (HicA-like mRNA interferase family)
MSRNDKLLSRLKTKPKDFTWAELVKILSSKGFKLFKGKGSRRKFIHEDSKTIIIAHDPHPDHVIKEYLIKEILTKLDEIGEK